MPSNGWGFTAQKEHSNPLCFCFTGPTALHGSSLVSSSSHNVQNWPATVLLKVSKSRYLIKRSNLAALSPIHKNLTHHLSGIFLSFTWKKHRDNFSRMKSILLAKHKPPSLHCEHVTASPSPAWGLSDTSRESHGARIRRRQRQAQCKQGTKHQCNTISKHSTSHHIPSSRNTPTPLHCPPQG